MNRSLPSISRGTTIALSAAVIPGFLYRDILSPDNVAARYFELLGSPGNWGDQLRNYRHVSALFYYLLYVVEIPYFSLMPIWCLVLAGGLIWSSYEFTRYVGISRRYFAPFLVAVALHGYMADIYNFPMMDFTYGVGLVGVAAAMRAIRVAVAPQGLALATASVLFTLLSYQPFALIVLTAAALTLVRRLLDEGDVDSGTLHRELQLVCAFMAGVIIFLVIKIAFGPEGRDASADYVWGHLRSYMVYIFDAHVLGGRNERFSPLHERLVYGISLLILMVLSIRAAARRGGMRPALACTALLLAVLISPSPFILFIKEFWPTARGMTGAVFLQVGGVAILAQRFLSERSSLLQTGSILMLTASAYWQAHLYALAYGQTRLDAVVVRQIVAEISEAGPISTETPLAVQSDWRNFAQPPGGNVSAFSTPWSREAIFTLLTGNFRSVPIPDGACLAPVAEATWRIENIGGTVVVCITPDPGQQHALAAAKISK